VIFLNLFIFNLVEWVPFKGVFYMNAIEGGKEGSAKLYVGRKWHEGKMLVGKIVEGINAVFCPYFGNELRFDNDFDILVVTSY
jgi:hypothetical protein